MSNKPNALDDEVKRLQLLHRELNLEILARRERMLAVEHEIGRLLKERRNHAVAGVKP